jgi:hypothetical protein
MENKMYLSNEDYFNDFPYEQDIVCASSHYLRRHLEEIDAYCPQCKKLYGPIVTKIKGKIDLSPEEDEQLGCSSEKRNEQIFHCTECGAKWTIEYRLEYKLKPQAPSSHNQIDDSWRSTIQ